MIYDEIEERYELEILQGFIVSGLVILGERCQWFRLKYDSKEREKQNDIKYIVQFELIGFVDGLVVEISQVGSEVNFWVFG